MDDNTNNDDIEKMISDALNNAQKSFDEKTSKGPESGNGSENATIDPNFTEMLKNMKETFSSLPGMAPIVESIIDSVSHKKDRSEVIDSNTIEKHALETLGSVPPKSISAETADKYKKITQEVNLWLDAQTDFTTDKDTIVKIMSPRDWITESIPAWKKIAVPVIKASNDATIENVSQQMNDLSEQLGDNFGEEGEGEAKLGFKFNDFSGMLPISKDNLSEIPDFINSFNSSQAAVGVGRSIGKLAKIALVGTDFSLQLFGDSIVFVHENIVNFAKESEVEMEQMVQFLALREVALVRLFLNVSWLRGHIFSILQRFAQDVRNSLPHIDDIQDIIGDADPNDMQEIAKNIENAMLPRISPEQEQASRDFDNILAIIEGWVDFISFKSGAIYIKDISKMREIMSRRRALGNNGDLALRDLTGMNIKPKNCTKAAEIWERLDRENGGQILDKYWKHPDTLPVIDAEDDKGGKTRSADANSNNTEESSKIDWDDLLL
ncbi:MAG: zinc-dependent metalloprotease [Candidatus Ancillula sp.]|jgi:putative hydrolase|nr:zinc-dependent metalloprotease [Candidatus Ancillula sp.]